MFSSFYRSVVSFIYQFLNSSLPLAISFFLLWFLKKLYIPTRSQIVGILNLPRVSTSTFKLIYSISSRGGVSLTVNSQSLAFDIDYMLSTFARADLDIDIAVCWDTCCPNKVFQSLLNTPSQWFCCMSCTSRSALAKKVRHFF